MKILIVNAYGKSNRGDSVLLDECLSDIIFQYPDATITVSVFDSTEESMTDYPNVCWSERLGNSSGIKYFVKLKTLKFLFLSWLAVLFPWSNLEQFLPALQRKTLDALRKCDMVVSAPGGYIHDTNLAYLIALFHLHLATLLHKTVVLAPQSIGPIDGLFARKITHQVLSKIAYICSRESYTYDFLTNELGIMAKQVYRTGDSAFWNDNVKINQARIVDEITRLGINSSQRIFGMTVVGWKFPKMNNPESAYMSYISSMAKIADHMAFRYKLTPVIFNQVSDDLPTANQVRLQAKSAVIVDSHDHDPCVLRALIQRSTVFLGTRFHSCIFSMMSGRPTFAIAYLPKTKSIMNDLRLSSRYTPINSLDISYTIAQLSLDIENIDIAETEIISAVTTYRQTFLRLRDVIGIIKQQRDDS